MTSTAGGVVGDDFGLTKVGQAAFVVIDSTNLLHSVLRGMCNDVTSVLSWIKV